jgi:EAL domain-containing protein (putative c-di-GMP-specific phosphodiesterase class I)
VDEHVVRAIVDVARSLRIKTVAESVADDATIKLLRKHHVDYAQGFHIGRPIPIASRRNRRAPSRAATAPVTTAQRSPRRARRPD